MRLLNGAHTIVGAGCAARRAGDGARSVRRRTGRPLSAPRDARRDRAERSTCRTARRSRAKCCDRFANPYIRHALIDITLHGDGEDARPRRAVDRSVLCADGTGAVVAGVWVCGAPRAVARRAAGRATRAGTSGSRGFRGRADSRGVERASISSSDAARRATSRAPSAPTARCGEMSWPPSMDLPTRWPSISCESLRQGVEAALDAHLTEPAPN